MSTDYRFVDEVKFKDVKSRIESMGLFISDSKDADKDSFCITDGDAYLWCYNASGSAVFSRYGANDVEDMLNIISDTFATEIIDEYHDDFLEDDEDTHTESSDV